MYAARTGRGLTGLVIPILLSLCLGAAEAAEPEPVPAIDPELVIAYRGDVVLTQQELDAAFSKLPAESRLLFIRDGARVDQLIRSLLRRKVLASEARKAEFDQDPLIADRMTLAAEKELAEAWIRHIEEQAPAADYEALAREDFLVNPDRYRAPETLDVSHILIGTDERGSTDARALADEITAELEQDHGRFDELVEAYSDDPAKAVNGGRYPGMKRGQMVKPFEKAAFALEQPGEISAPVETEYGYHIIRLNGRGGGELRDFEEVKVEAVERARRKYLENYRDRYMRQTLANPVVIPEGAVEIMAKRHFGENLELAPNIPE